MADAAIADHSPAVATAVASSDRERSGSDVGEMISTIFPTLAAFLSVA